MRHLNTETLADELFVNEYKIYTWKHLAVPTLTSSSFESNTNEKYTPATTNTTPCMCRSVTSTSGGDPRLPSVLTWPKSDREPISSKKYLLGLVYIHCLVHINIPECIIILAESSAYYVPGLEHILLHLMQWKDDTCDTYVDSPSTYCSIPGASYPIQSTHSPYTTTPTPQHAGLIPNN